MKLKPLLTVAGIGIVIAAIFVQSEYSDGKVSAADLRQGVEVEASCGQCQFGMAGTGCDLAVRIGGKCLWVVGTGIDDHGDAHGDHGFCNAVRQAVVKGEIRGDEFHADSFELKARDSQ